MNAKAEVSQDTKSLNVIFVHSSLDDYGLSPEEFRIYCHLARRAGKGVSWAAIDSMAAKCRMSPKSVRKSLRALVDLNLVRFKAIPGRPNQYHLADASEWKPQPAEAPLETPPGDTPYRNDTPAVLDTPPLAETTGAPSQMDRRPLPKRHPKDIPKGDPISKSKEGQVSLFSEEEKSKPEKEELPPALDTPEFRAAFAEFEADRKHRKNPVTPIARKKLLTKMAPWGSAAAVEALNESIEKGWAGVFEPRRHFRAITHQQHADERLEFRTAQPRRAHTKEELEKIKQAWRSAEEVAA